LNPTPLQLARLAAVALVLAAAGCGGGGGGGGPIGAGDTGYAIHLQYESSLTSTQKAAFDGAAARISKIITGKLSTVAFHGEKCAAGPAATDPSYAVNADVTNLLIFVRVGAIDGVGQVLGQSGPCFLRLSNALPVVGIMNFDSADLASLEHDGTLDAVILHEMLHVVGFGTAWDATARPTPLASLIDGEGGATPTFIGAAAVTAYQDLGGPASTVPVEGCSTSGTPKPCGGGTRDSHWTETVFQNELMTGWIDPLPDPLSKVTIASLADLGYTVDMTQADAFTVPAAVSPQVSKLTAGAARLHLVHDTLDVPPQRISDE
jgi:hypothetical protein